MNGRRPLKFHSTSADSLQPDDWTKVSNGLSVGVATGGSLKYGKVFKVLKCHKLDRRHMG